MCNRISKILDFKLFNDDRGSLIALENNKEIPFEIKRIYYIYNVAEGKGRAFHAHKTMEEVVICINGSCKCSLDNGKTREHFLLEDPKKGLYNQKGTWVELYDFSPDCILLVLSDSDYDEADYIRKYSNFLEFIETKADESEYVLS